MGKPLAQLRVEDQLPAAADSVQSLECDAPGLTRGLDEPNVLCMKSFTAIVERCPSTGLYGGYVPGCAKAHFRSESLDELRWNLAEVIRMLIEVDDDSA
jgi:predicted RNase H-like HicB family nuclease